MKKFIIISIAIATIIISIPLSSIIRDRRNARAEQQNLGSIVGTYNIIVSKSDAGLFKNLEMYDDLKLSFNRNMTFHLSRSVPFFADSIGHYKVAGGELEDANVMYLDKSKAAILFEHYYGMSNVINIRYPKPVSDSLQVNSLVFVKVDTEN